MQITFHWLLLQFSAQFTYFCENLLFTNTLHYCANKIKDIVVRQKAHSKIECCLIKWIPLCKMYCKFVVGWQDLQVFS